MKQTLKILQVEDSESDAALIVRHMERAGYQVQARRVEDAAEMRQALDEEEWDVVISDHQMAQFDAPGALLILQESDRDLPFLVVSGAIGEELAVAMMKSGAHDYLLKNDLARLAPAVEREIRDARTRHERRLAEAELRESRDRLAMALSATRLGTFDSRPHTGRRSGATRQEPVRVGPGRGGRLGCLHSRHSSRRPRPDREHLPHPGHGALDSSHAIGIPHRRHRRPHRTLAGHLGPHLFRLGRRARSATSASLWTSPSGSNWKSNSARPRNWRASAGWRAEWLTTSTTCLRSSRAMRKWR